MMTKNLSNNIIDSRLSRRLTKYILKPLLLVSVFPIALSTISTGLINNSSDKISYVISYEENYGRAVNKKPERKPDFFVRVLKGIEATYSFIKGDLDGANSAIRSAFGLLRKKDFSSLQQKVDEIWGYLGSIDSRISYMESQIDRLPFDEKKVDWQNTLLDTRLRVVEAKLTVARFEFEIVKADND